MQAIWDEQPFTSIYPRDLEKRGVVLRGRVEGRVLASLKRMGLINVKRNGGIMLRHYSGGASLAAMKRSFRQDWSGVMSSDDDRRKVDEFLTFPEARSGLVRVLRYCAGPPACHHQKLPVIKLAPFMNEFIRLHTPNGERSRKAEAREEHMAPLAHKCYYHKSSRVPGSALAEFDAPQQCQAHCAATKDCAYFSFSRRTGACSAHGLHAARVNTTDDDLWCGPNPLCPNRHWLKGSHSRQSTSDSRHGNFVCTTSSPSNNMFPWPWFNEFSLEFWMLRRWQSELLTCRGHHSQSVDTCMADADIIVVPSLYMHATGFRSMNPWDKTAQSEENYLTSIDREKRHRAYWDKLRMHHLRHDEVTNTTSWPLLVVHYRCGCADQSHLPRMRLSLI